MTEQQEIKQREAQQKMILESVQAGIVLIDPITHKIVDVNTTAAHLLGAPKEAIIGSVCHRFICPAEVGNCPITDLGQTVDNAERVLLTADGMTRPVLKSVSKITLGRHAYLLESFIDISDRKQMERALLESEAYYRAIFESTATGMAILEQDMTVAMVNNKLEQLTGFSKKEVEGLRSWTEFVAPEDLELMKTYHRARRRDDASAPKQYEFRLLTKDGTRREAFLTAAMIPGTQRSVASIVDITALKTAQEAVRKQAAMLDAAHDAIMTLDPDGTITYWNRGAERLYGWTTQEVECRNVHALLQTTFPESRETMWPKLLKNGAWEGELIHVARDGRPVTVASSWTLLKDEKGNASAILEISSDVTERKQMEQQLDSTLADLQRSNAELEQFAYIASHDLQEPLRMITSYIQIIEDDYKGKLDADADQYIAFAVDGAKRMQTLIDDLLAYSRVGTRGEPFMPTSMDSVLSKAIANLEVAIEESHAVVTHDQLPTVLGDESQLIQLLQNLLGNAIKFRGDDAPTIHVSVEETKDGWMFSVRDNGIGIDMKYAERIFTVFQRLHAREDYPGTGIGLAVVKKIVERHGGRIWVESAPAKGSTFYFTIPQREDSVL
jgi:PAS domain S-box-containing protein